MGEEISRGRGGRQVEPRRKAGTAEVEAYEALPRRTGTAGNGQGTGGDGGKAGWERRQGQVGTRERTAGDGLRPLSAVP